MDKTTNSVFSILNEFHLKLKNIFLLLLVVYFYCFAKTQSHNVFSTLPNVVKSDVENNNVVSTLSDVVHINAETHNVDSTLFTIVNFNVEVHNIVSTLIWGCPTPWRHINLKTTLNRRWNVCWVVESFFNMTKEREITQKWNNVLKFCKLHKIFAKCPFFSLTLQPCSSEYLTSINFDSKMFFDFKCFLWVFWNS